MKVKLLNDAGYGDMGKVKFPATVEATRYVGGYEVSKEELYRIGADTGAFDALQKWAFRNETCRPI